ncbi:MAG: L-aspartate oxidase [Deltaproteobacteria bacterium]|nr:L-aspartate oxidase [Deltaproteobacteria bacterium]
MDTVHTDYLVIGSGLAGLNFALFAAEQSDVVLVTKREPTDCATAWAQGGIASVTATDDTFAEHVEDTLTAGAGLCKENIARLCVEAGPRVIERLDQLGVEFDRSETEADGGGYDLGREGGHSKRRILHAADFTGREIERALLHRVQKTPRIQLMAQSMGVDLITSQKLGLPGPNRCLGAYVLDRKTGRVRLIVAKATLLATGGVGKVYLYTSNPDVATGDGIAMAYRAGAKVANMEFIQFHPTCLYHPQAKSFLISEALRGEGGILQTKAGVAFMPKYHALKDLAPRDIVARAIDSEIKAAGADCVYLDMTHHTREFLEQRFPNIFARCTLYGIDMSKEGIPVVPAEHYVCGGVLSDEDGRTNIDGLYVAGETACTGLHGANRLASNSLLEAAVFSERAAKHAKGYIASARNEPKVPAWEERGVVDSDEMVIVSHNWDEIRSTMWNYVGIVRTTKRLQRAKARLDLVKDEIREYYWNFKVTSDLLELRNIADVGDLIIRSALMRKESRGLHYTRDFPDAVPSECHDTVLSRE